MNFVRLQSDSSGRNGSTGKFNLFDSKMALFHCQFQSCLQTTLEDWPNVPGEISSIVTCNSKIMHILSILVGFENWVQVIAHEASKNNHRSANTLRKAFAGKRSASKIGWKHFHWPLVPHLQTVTSLGEIKFPEELLLPSAVLHLTKYWLDGCFWCSHLHFDCCFSWDSQKDVVLR